MNPTPNKLRVACIQLACVADRDQNLANVAKAVAQAAQQGAELILLQELVANLYFCQTQDPELFNLAEPIPGPTTQFLAKLAQQFQVLIVTSVFEKRSTGVYHNTAVVLDKNGDIAGCYRKMHIPDDPGYNEKFYFTPGDLGFKPIQTSIGKLGVLVCWDQWYPEAARLMALAGANLLLYPTAIGWGSQENDAAEMKRQRDAWMLIQRAHAVANGLPVIVANRTGFESRDKQPNKGIQFWGTSFIAGQEGELLSEASQDQVEIIMADLDLNRSEYIRRSWPFMRDRRIDSYDDILKRIID